MALRTKNAIRRSFVELLAERPFDKISVRDIAERSEVTRNTFYYYYTDIYALTEDVFESEVENLSESIDSYDSWQKAFLAATAFAAENKRMILHLHNSAHRDILARYFHKTILTGMLSYVQKEAEGLDVSERKIMALARFYTAALAGLTVEWLDSGMRVRRTPSSPISAICSTATFAIRSSAAVAKPTTKTSAAFRARRRDRNSDPFFGSLREERRCAPPFLSASSG